MNSYAVFLRGVNVGGITIKMAELKEALKTAAVFGRENAAGQRQRGAGQ